MFKKYRCTYTGEVYKIWAMPNGLYRIEEQFGERKRSIVEFMPSSLELVKEGFKEGVKNE